MRRIDFEKAETLFGGASNGGNISAILAKAFGGELVLQPPNEGLASALPERIKAECDGPQLIGTTSRRGRRASDT